MLIYNLFSYGMLLSSSVVPTNKPMILFFTGGNSYMPKYIYSSFLNKLENEYQVNVINYENSLLSVYELTALHPNSEFVAIGHSSGCTTLINDCSDHPNINKCVLLDPVDNNVKKTPKFDNVLQINSEKSYKWKFNPMPKPPFIPAFSMDSSKFSQITKVSITDYGHCDILDEPFANFMHNTVAEGSDDRSIIDKYKYFLIDLIDCYLREDNITNLQDYSIQYTIS
jgi:hypothetical protein